MTHAPDVSRRWTITLRTAAVAAVLVGATACSASASEPEPVANAAATAAAPSQQSAGTAINGLNLGVAEVPTGTVVTNDGFTVYRFEKDKAKPSRSTCDGACAQAWPPVMATETPWLKGVASKDVGTVTRSDGSKQLTLGGWPVYRYAKDTAPGDTKGHGVGGTWCAMDPAGKPAKLKTPAASDSGSYGSTPAPSAGSGSSGSGSAGSAPAPSSGSGGGYSSGGYSSGGY